MAGARSQRCAGVALVVAGGALVMAAVVADIVSDTRAQEAEASPTAPIRPDL